MKKIIMFFIFVLIVACVLGGIPVGALSDISGLSSKDTLKILAIGNSFSEDATEYIPVIARDCGVKNIIVGNMYIGGCTIETHAKNARENKGAYKYYKNTSFSLMSNCPTKSNISLESALKDEAWDVITLQQASGKSGLDTSYNNDLDYLVGYIKELCPDAKLGWHMTWAYQKDYSSWSFSNNYNSDQIKMYNMIVEAVKNKIVVNNKFDFIIPAGTAIQNARTGYLGDTLTRDGMHLSLDMGRYIAGVTWMKSLGFSLDGLKSMPSRVRPKVLPFVKECVENAVENPFEITNSIYTYEPGTTPPATEAVTEKNTEPATEAQTTAVETKAETVESSTSETSEPDTLMPGKDYTGVIIVAVCAALAAVVIVVVVLIVKKKKK